MDLFNVLVNELYNKKTEVLPEETPDGFGFPITPIVSYLCFETPLDLYYSKDELISENREDRKIEKTESKKAKKEIKTAKKGKTSELTGTVYKLTDQQKRALKYIKKKYGKELTKDIKMFRNRFLAPYQVIKDNLQKSKSLYAKDVIGMSKEEYLINKRRVEAKIANMRSDKYTDLNKEYFGLSDKYSKLDNLSSIASNNNLNATALRGVFEKYNVKSSNFSDSDFIAIKNRTDNLDNYLTTLLNKLSSSSNNLTDKDVNEFKRKVDSFSEIKTSISDLTKQKPTDEVDSFRKLRRALNSIEDGIENLDIDNETKEDVRKKLNKAITIHDKKITSSSFADEFELFLLRDKIAKDISKEKNSKYYDEYKNQINKVKGRISDRKLDIVKKMGAERESKTLTDSDKRIYELKPGRPKNSDILDDYTLKIKEDDFFDSKFYSKTPEMREAEKKIDAEIKRFERGLKAKMEEKDFKLLKKYRLINNLITVKNMKPERELFGDGKKDEE